MHPAQPKSRRSNLAFWVTICGLLGSATSGLAQTFQPTGDPAVELNCTQGGGCNAQSTLLPNGKVFVLTASPSAQLYDPGSGTWALSGNITQSSFRLEHTATLLPTGKVLIAGGTGPAGFIPTAELYDPNAIDPVTGRLGAFTPTGSLAEPRREHTATLLQDGRVLIVGGFGPTGGLTAELYDPATGTFILTGSISHVRANHTATLLSDGKVLIAGGFGNLSPECPVFGFCLTAELYAPTTGTFTRVGDMSSVRVDHTATRLPNGKVLMVGGCNNRDVNGQCTSVAGNDLYDPATSSFTSASNMITPRWTHASTLLQDGRVFIFGGQTASGVDIVDLAEIFDPTTGIFSGTGSLSDSNGVNLGYPLARLLSPGCQVLLAGGPKAELFTPAGCQGANQCQIDLQTAQQNLSTCQANLQSATAQVSQLQTDLSAATASIQSLQTQVATANATIAQTNAAMASSVSSLESNFRQVFGNPTFVVPGATPLQQLQNIVQAVVGLKKQSKQGVYNNLGGTP